MPWAPTDFLTSERVMPNRSHDDVMVGRRSPTDSIEGFTLDVPVLGAERHAAIVSLVDVLPEADRQLDKRWLFAMQSADVAPPNEANVVIKLVAFPRPGLPRPNRGRREKSTGVVVPLGRKFGADGEPPARFPDFVPACAFLPS